MRGNVALVAGAISGAAATNAVKPASAGFPASWPSERSEEKMNLSTSLMTMTLAIFCGLFTRRKQNPPDLDQQVLDQLKQAGSNFSKPHNIEFFLYFPSKEAATSAAEEVKNEVGSVEVKHGPNSPEWLCFATKKMMPAHGELIRLRTRFDSIASRLDGNYDGWGTEVVN